ncbi:thioesterase II family protein [Algicola sagamiensis]|uniref:thioesterase II family protein n=1 Tax=Algicola sagamiensis TaxID=163869 RepID=UPI0003643CE2|nr:alpha/beta fold hydrolase [Algicola sagamiensis]
MQHHKQCFIRQRVKPYASLRLICFAYAGGGANVFHQWGESLPEYVEVICIQLPGRGARMLEPNIDDMPTLVEHLLSEIDVLLDIPYIIFGHSLGSRIAIEYVKQLQALRKRLPLHFIASGSRAAHLPSDNNPIFDLPDDEFIQEIEQLNGTPKEVLENQELMSLYMPVLRADFKLADTYLYHSEQEIGCPVTVFGGELDDISQVQLEAWGTLFSGPCALKMFAGDHFFIHSDRKHVLLEVQKIIERENQAALV